MVLFIVVAVITTLVLFSGGPNGAFVFAQQTSPVTSIEFVNPDDDSSNEISAKNDTSTGTTSASYHLVAWVANAPAGATVSFSYRVGTGTQTPIGTATPVGADTFEFHWPGTAMPPDGAYNLVASLSTGGATPAASDTEAVEVNNVTEPPPAGIDPTTAQAETVEITSPLNGGTLNFVDAPGTAGFTATIQVKHSSGAADITPYFTTSAPGAEPTWVECEGGSETAAEAVNGVDCELPSGTNGTSVRAVAVVASDNPTDPIPVPDPDSGDAHRVTGTGASPSPSPSTTSPSPTPSTTSPSPTPSTTSPSPTSSPTSSPTASPSPTTTTPPPPVAYSSTTTLKHKGNKFFGKVKSDLKRCTRGRNTLLKKEMPGKDKTVGKDKTNKKGQYSIKEPNADGTYYTIAKAKSFTDGSGRPVTCAKDKSPKKKV